eukprot:scaffold2334_cov118-Cylindrotheca_fusiformis.AAC.20
MSVMSMMIQVDELSEVFSDLTPIPQDDGPEPVCVIQYPTSFRLAYDYMRAIWKANEMSDRALRLTSLCLKLNPANYTVWQFRRRCLRHLGLDKARIQRDLDMTAVLGGSNPKNYQIWFHRRALLECHENLKDDFLATELEYIAHVFQEDSKNHHAWSHRQWFIKTIDDDDVWKNEIEFGTSSCTKQLIEEDPRNNSAWNHRWMVIHRGGKTPLALEVAKSEADFALDTGATPDPYNESPWRYLVGILREQHKRQPNPMLMREYEQKASNLRQVVTNSGQDPDTCAHLTFARIDLLEMIADKDSLGMDLADEHDTIRKKYWMLRVDQLQQKVSNLKA